MIKCSNCQSEKVITDLQLSDMGMNSHDHKMHIAIEMAPKNLWNRKKQVYPVYSTICCNCGTINLKIEDKERLWQDYQKLKSENG